MDPSQPSTVAEWREFSRTTAPSSSLVATTRKDATE